MPTLYEIADKYAAAIERGFVVDEDTGEIIEDESALDNLEGELNDKLEACAVVVKELRADAEAIRDEERKLAERRHAKERKAEWLRNYIAYNLETIGQTKLETPRAVIRTRRTRSVDVYDVDSLPEEYKRSETVTTPRKREIGDAIKEGETIPGARLIENDSVSIR